MIFRFNYKLFTGGLITGSVLQLNYAREKLEANGLISCFKEYWARIVMGALSCVFLFYLISLLVRFLNSRKTISFSKYELNNLFFSCIILLGYLLFPPSSQLLITLLLLVPLFYHLFFHPIITIKNNYFRNLSILYGLILILQLSKDFLQLKYSPAQNYLFYTKEITGILIYLVIPAMISNFTKIYGFIVLLVFYIAAFITDTHILTYGTDIPPSAYYAIWETNSTEAIDYIKQYLNFEIVTVSTLLACIIFLPFFIIKKQDEVVPVKVKLLVISILIALSYLTNTYEQNLPNKFFESYKKFNDEVNTVKQQIEFRKNNPINNQAKIHIENKAQDLTVVLVIGESASKYHQGLYNYGRNTNPLLNSIRNELLVYDSVIAPNSHTNPVLSKILTFANNENMDPLYSKRNIVEYMKAAGYKTFWLSNQAFAENFSTIATSIGLVSDWYIFTNHNLDDYQNTNELYYDELLLKPFNLAINDKSPKKFIVLHLMGSHSDKTKRYPKEFDVFRDWTGIPSQSYNREGVKDIINAHDNSVLYNDWILYSLTSAIKTTKQKAILIYLSDHGEELFEYRDFSGHAEANSSIYMLDIPFFVWFSDAAKKDYEEKIVYIKSHLSRKYQSDDLEHSIIDLTGCKSADYDSTRSLFSPYFKYRKRTIEGHDYDKMIAEGKKSITD